jgi:hypothetical protein
MPSSRTGLTMRGVILVTALVIFVGILSYCYAKYGDKLKSNPKSSLTSLF